MRDFLKLHALAALRSPNAAHCTKHFLHFLSPPSLGYAPVCLACTGDGRVGTTSELDSSQLLQDLNFARLKSWQRESIRCLLDLNFVVGVKGKVFCVSHFVTHFFWTSFLLCYASFPEATHQISLAQLAAPTICFSANRRPNIQMNNRISGLHARCARVYMELSSGLLPTLEPGGGSRRAAGDFTLFYAQKLGTFKTRWCLRRKLSYCQSL